MSGARPCRGRHLAPGGRDTRTGELRPALFNVPADPGEAANMAKYAAAEASVTAVDTAHEWDFRASERDFRAGPGSRTGGSFGATRVASGRAGEGAS